MKSVDTNILVRLLTRDDETQYQKSYRIFQDNEVFIADTVILETEWVLRYAYGFSSEGISSAFQKLFGLPNVHTANPLIIHDALQWHQLGLDFADAIHLAGSQHCTEMLSFDKSFVKKSKGLSSCPVSQP